MCVGTDSLACCPTLSVLDELREVHRRFPELSPELVLTMGTINGARALGSAHLVGSLEAGKRADFAVFTPAEHSNPNTPESPEEALLDGPWKLGRLYVNGLRVR